MRPATHIACLLVALLTSASGLSAVQDPLRDVAKVLARGTATIAGVVVTDDESHSPMRHAVVRIIKDDGAEAGRSEFDDQQWTSTDDDGRYEFSGLVAGTYLLVASKPAYVTAMYGATHPETPRVLIPIADGQQFVAGPLVLERGAVVTGQVVDPSGHAVQNSDVFARRVDLTKGSPQFTSGQQNARASTDSRGIYRIFGLAAGSYVVSTEGPMTLPVLAVTPAQELWLDQQHGDSGSSATIPPSAPPFVQAPTYAPSAADVAQATVIDLHKAEELQNVDIAIVRIGTARLSGVVSGVDGQPVTGAFVMRYPKSATHSATPLANSRSGSDGTFTMNGIAPGEYVLVARAASDPVATVASGRAASLPTTPLTLWAEQEISVNGDDLTGLALHLQPGATISGTIRFEGTSPVPTDPEAYQPTLAALDGQAPTITVGAPPNVPTTDRTFQVAGVSPGQYRLTGIGEKAVTSGSIPTWSVKSVQGDGRDLLDTPFEVTPGQDVSNVVVTYTDRHTELDGRIVDRSGRPTSPLTVVVFTTSRERWSAPLIPRWTITAPVSIDGSFRVTGLPPGDYYVSALTDAPPAQHVDATFLESLVKTSSTVTLTEGSTRAQTFRVGG